MKNKKTVYISFATDIINTGHFMFTHPDSFKFISGKFFDYNGKTMSCSFYDLKDVETVKTGNTINKFTFFDTRVTKMCSVKVNDVISIVASTPIVIVEILEIYEEN